MFRKSLTIAATLAIGALLTAPIAAAQDAAKDWPSRPIKLIVPFPPGGVIDSIPRKLAGHLEKMLGQPVVIENKVGGGTLVANDLVAKAKDNHTFGFIVRQNVSMSAVGAMTPYDLAKDLHGVLMLGSAPDVLVVHKDLPVNSVQELIAYAKANPGKLLSASGGVASGAHFATEALKIGANIDVKHVPYPGTAPAYVDLIAGRVNMMFPVYGSGKQHWESGAVRPLAVTSPERFSLMPNLPTMREVSGIADFTVVEWYAVWAPSSMPKEIMVKFNKAMTEILATPEFVELYKGYGLEYKPMSVDDSHAYLMKDLDTQTKVAKAANIKVEQ